MGTYQIQTYEFIVLCFLSFAGFIAFINMAVDKVWDYLMKRQEEKRKEMIKGNWVYKLTFRSEDNTFSRYAVGETKKEEVIKFFKEKSYYRDYDITVEEMVYLTKYDKETEIGYS